MSRIMTATLIVALLPLIGFGAYGLSIFAQPVFIGCALWAIGVVFAALVFHLIFQRSNKATPCYQYARTPPVKEARVYEPYVQGMYD